MSIDPINYYSIKLLTSQTITEQSALELASDLPFLEE
jgi:hypothetical protein